MTVDNNRHDPETNAIFWYYSSMFWIMDTAGWRGVQEPSNAFGKNGKTRVMKGDAGGPLTNPLIWWSFTAGSLPPNTRATPEGWFQTGVLLIFLITSTHSKTSFVSVYHHEQVSPSCFHIEFTSTHIQSTPTKGTTKLTPTTHRYQHC
jgi:hypothetical protein